MIEIVEGTIPEKDMKAVEKHIIDNVNFPFFYEPQTTSLKYPAMMHILVGRYDRPPLTKFEINSPYFGLIEKIFLEFCYKNKIKVNKILRAAINLTWYSPDKYGDPHTDHSIKDNPDHKVCMMYLNEVEYGPTFIFNEKEKGLDHYTIAKEIEFKKGKIVIFPGQYCHAAGFVRKHKEIRIAAVVTFE